MKVVVTYACENLHLTEVEMVSPEIQPDGSVVGYTGSDASYCQVCESSNMVAMDSVAT